MKEEKKQNHNEIHMEKKRPSHIITIVITALIMGLIYYILAKNSESLAIKVSEETINTLKESFNYFYEYLEGNIIIEEIINHIINHPKIETRNHFFEIINRNITNFLKEEIKKPPRYIYYVIGPTNYWSTNIILK
jgi:hypothetical protein